MGGATTARQLAHHMAGLPEAGIAEAALGPGNWTELAVGRYIHGLAAPRYAPGNEHRYSNLGYVLLARLVVAVSDMAFADFVATRLGGGPGIGFAADAAGFRQAPLLRPLPLTQGDGGLWSSATALAEWLYRQNSDPLGIGSIIEVAGRLRDGTTTDYGWGVGLRHYRGERLLIHGGSWTGATCKSMRCPTLGLVVVVMTAGADMETVVALADAALEDGYSSSSAAVR